jgi:hypothetical protein
MTVIVTDVLIDAGVQINGIAWGLQSGTDEIDIVCFLYFDVWVFELKDREFGAGDAHPFNYRRSLLKADEAFIVTTEKVSADAKAIFMELSEQKSPSIVSDPKGLPYPTIVEGLDRIAETLRHKCQDASDVVARFYLHSVLRSTEIPFLDELVSSLR